MSVKLKLLLIPAALVLTTNCTKANTNGELPAPPPSPSDSTDLVIEGNMIPKSVYYDKTLACILSHVAGLLSGFEFVGGNSPQIALPDDWFDLCKGPYGGGPLRGSAGENYVENLGRIYSDDDYHIDFFNQHILKATGPNPSSAEIAAKWKQHQVNDWGGGYGAMKIINEQGLIPPQTGMYEFGNPFGWCTEAYIENETVGCVYPGMPETAGKITNRFSSVTGDFESQLWGKFYGVLYSNAYFETNSVEAMKKASVVLHPGSWARKIYDKAIALHAQYPDDWREAVRELEKGKRGIYLMDNPQTAYDVNNGFFVLSVLYGNNDYLETIRIASLAGYDGDCTAAAAGGLMGIIKGMKGVPETVKSIVWANGKGVLVNFFGRTPHIKQDYPYEQTFNSLAKLYQQNAEKAITYYGGQVKSDRYIIKLQPIQPSGAIEIANSDFESADNNIQSSKNNPSINISSAYSITAHNGIYHGQISTISAGDDGKLFFNINSLTAGRTYRLSAYLTADNNAFARLYASGDIDGGSEEVSIKGDNNKWFHRSLIFTANGSNAEIGLRGLQTGDSPSSFYIDDILLEEIKTERIATLSTTDINNMKLTAPESDNYILRIKYSNPNAMTNATIMTSYGAQGNYAIPPTPASNGYNWMDIPVKLSAGQNNISLTGVPNITVYKIELYKAYF